MKEVRQIVGDATRTRRLPRLSALLCTGLLLLGCGQRGPLFLPAPAVTATPAGAAAPATPNAPVAAPVP
ncbi:lipoprotein [Hydrogenophaga sp.]|uniref:LPS translocon maturation chaperone LptM n=1 Tax=Hydrogenophaga sp. TaxID=1904254 RepID=UPI0019B340AD|nr:hypothetical protein [Hydrogenophaga sp.]